VLAVDRYGLFYDYHRDDFEYSKVSCEGIKLMRWDFLFMAKRNEY
jgi:hypothetical protein